MKTKLLILLLAFVMLFSITACGDGTGNGNGGGGEGVIDYSGYLYYEGTTPIIIATDSTSISKASLLYSGLKTVIGAAPTFYQTTNVQSDGHEIIIGETTRDISAKAYRKLRAVKKNDDFDVGYVIYAQGNSVAIAYDDNYGGIALDFAIEEFLGNIVKDNKALDLKSGVVSSASSSVLDYYAAKDATYKAEAWAALSAELGVENIELYDALVNYYKQYDPAMVTWFANLYAPEIGGFYYSNSARDNMGYQPDIESTGQALGFINSSGMMREHGGHWNKIISEENIKAIGNYIKSLQAPDGYFYNYQWTKASHGTSRLARDLSSATGILSSVGMKPTYATPLGGSGDGVVVPFPDAANPVVEPKTLTSSVATAVSKVVLAAHADYLENCDTLFAYLEQRRLAGNSWYGIGSNITSQMNQIIARDKVLKSEFYRDTANTNKEYSGLVDLVINWFNQYQREDTGHWDTSDNYLAVNGILKISGIYRQAGVCMKYSEKLATAAFNAITSKEACGGIVDVYNTWSALTNVISNLRSYGEPEMVDGKLLTADERADRLLAMVRATAPAAVAATVEKLNTFKKDDGSYSYTPGHPATTSQGMPVTVPGVKEGDVNATVLAVTGITGSMFGSLGLSSFKINIFGSKELLVFLNIFENLGPVIKEGQDEPAKPIVDEPVKFDDNEVGEAPVDVRVSLGSGSAATIVKDSRGKGNVLEYNSVAGVGDYVYINNNNKNKTGKCIVFETEIKVESSSGGDYLAQITIGSHYLITLHKTGTGVAVYENTTVSSATSIQRKIADMKLNEWFKIRVEYYAEGKNAKPMTKIFINGELKAVSSNFYGMEKNATAPTVPNKNYDNVKFYVMKGPAMKFYLDNVYATVTDTAYTSVEDKENKLTFNDDKAAPTPAPAT